MQGQCFVILVLYVFIFRSLVVFYKSEKKTSSLVKVFHCKDLTSLQHLKKKPELLYEYLNFKYSSSYQLVIMKWLRCHSLYYHKVVWKYLIEFQSQPGTCFNFLGWGVIIWFMYLVIKHAFSIVKKKNQQHESVFNARIRDLQLLSFRFITICSGVF